MSERPGEGEFVDVVDGTWTAPEDCLLVEHSTDTDGVTTVLIKTPDGERRRLRFSWPSEA